jgi:hypothetical protein
MQRGLDMFWRQTCCISCILPGIDSIISLLSHFEFISLVPCYDDPVDLVARCLELPKVVDMEGRTEMIDEFVLVTIFVVAVAVSNGGVLFCLMLRYLMSLRPVPDDCKCGTI